MPMPATFWLTYETPLLLPDMKSFSLAIDMSPYVGCVYALDIIYKRLWYGETYNRAKAE